jgi:hypothetical protein
MPKPQIRRARTGCHRCKQSRRKCDEAQPRCSSCQKRGIHCQYGRRLVWADEVVEILAIDEFLWTQVPKRPATWTRPAEEYSDVEYAWPRKKSEHLSSFHFVNTSTDEIQVILGHANSNRRLPLTRAECCSFQQSTITLPRSLSIFDLILERPDQLSLLLLEYCKHSRLEQYKP